jgi:hypothetical protein
MATYFARKTGNVNATDVWATTPSGTASNLFPTFTNADVLVANSFTITINVNTTVAEVRNDTTGGATAGGFFDLANSVTLTANIIAGGVNNTSCVRFTLTGSAAIVGNCTAGTGAQHHAVLNSSSGTLTITGNVSAGAVGCCGAANSGNGIINITGNVTGGTGGINGGITAAGVRNGLTVSNTGVINITGNVTGGSGASAFGADNAYLGTISIVGTATGGTTVGASGVNNVSTGAINLTRAKGNAYGPGNSGGLAAGVGAANIGLGVIQIEELEYGTFGMSPTSGTGIRLKKLGSNVAVFNYVDAGAAKTLVDATQGQMPAASNVRDGVSYASGVLTGTCKVPAAASVAYGVPVDATTGTAYLSQSDVLAAVWGAATSSLTTAGSIGERLKNASTVATNSDQLAAALTAP